MKSTLLSAVLLSFVIVLCSSDSSAQRRAAVGRVCGDPTEACKTREDFQAFEIPFEYGKGMAISQSEMFYAVILKSVKLKADESDCETAIPESDRLEMQKLFPRNMVFVMRCWEAGQASYTNVADRVSFLGVYAGKTLADANSFLAKVKAAGNFKGAAVRRMRILINGT
jgi:hypothetical protein